MKAYEWICLAVICGVVGLVMLVILHALDNLLNTVEFRFNALYNNKLYLLDNIERQTREVSNYIHYDMPQEVHECQELDDSVMDTIDKFVKSTPSGDSRYLEGYRDGVMWVKSLLQKEETECT